MRQPGAAAAIAATAAATLGGRLGAARPAARAAATVSSAVSVAASPGIVTPCSARASAGERAQEAGDVLGAQHAGDEVQRARRQPAERLGQRRAGGRVVPAVEPELGRRPPPRPAGPRRSRCSRAGHSARVTRGGAGRLVAARARAARRARCRRSPPGARRSGSAAAGRAARGVLERHAAVLLPDLPVLAFGDRSGAPSRAARASITASASGGCGPTTQGTPALQDARPSRRRSRAASRRDTAGGRARPG